MIPYPYQDELSDEALHIIRNNGMVYLAMEERTGKTLTSILVAEKSAAKDVLVITKKKAIEGWNETLIAFKHTKQYTVTNYHQAHKAKGNYDLIILDESHNYISSYPKHGKIWKELFPVVFGKPIIYISATPYAQGPQMLYSQLKLSAWSPWLKYKKFYQWFKEYGKPYTIQINGFDVRQYDRCHEDKILADVLHIFITKTREELGFEHEPEDQLHYVELEPETKLLYNALVKDEIAELPQCTLVCDTKAKLRVSLHMLEGGTTKMYEDYYVLDNAEKAAYVLENFGDTLDMVIMYNYKAELTKLTALFSLATLLQATSYAEGVDLHKFKHLIIYSQDFSTARHTQRRARQCNKKRAEPINVHYLLVKGGLSEQVYKTVSVNKKNFVDSVYYKETL